MSKRPRAMQARRYMKRGRFDRTAALLLSACMAFTAISYPAAAVDEVQEITGYAADAPGTPTETVFAPGEAQDAPDEVAGFEEIERIEEIEGTDTEAYAREGAGGETNEADDGIRNITGTDGLPQAYVDAPAVMPAGTVESAAEPVMEEPAAEEGTAPAEDENTSSLPGSPLEEPLEEGEVHPAPPEAAPVPADRFTGDWAADILTAAYSQIGIAESAEDRITDENGEAKGSTPYGVLYGDPYGAWDVMFVRFCMDSANVPEDRFPRMPDAETWRQELSGRSLYRSAANYTPSPGDVAFYSDDASAASRAGIVSGADEGGQVRVIMGDVGGCVCETAFEAGTPSIMGYGLPSAAQYGISYTAVLYTDESRTVPFDANGYRIDVIGTFPPGSHVEAFPVETGLGNGGKVYSAWDITVYDAGGNPVQPSVPVTVRITTPEAAEALRSGEELAVYHVHDGGTGTVGKAPELTETGYEFETDGFSVFILGSRPSDVIHINSYEQLGLIGSDAVVTDTDLEAGGIGKGTAVAGSSGEPLKYSAGGDYFLDCDIPFPEGEAWRITPDFTGSFAGPEDADASRLYDEGTDTVYIQNVYQLSALFAPEREDIPVVTGDTDPDSFGRGKLIFNEGQDGAPGEDRGEDTEKGPGYLRYGASHRYVLSAAFTAALAAPPVKARGLRSAGTGSNNDRVDGRDYFGQATAEIGGTTYILIGDRQQLDAINYNEGTKVYGPVYSVQQTYRGLTAGWEDMPGTEKIVYPGDADLISDVWTGSGTEDFSEKHLYGTAKVGHILGDYDYRDLGTEGGALITGSTRTVYCAVDNTTGLPDTGRYLEGNNGFGTLSYKKDGDYIVFRNIDMLLTDRDDKTWKPLMFTGTMYGAAAEGREDRSTLWDSGKTAINTPAKPEVSNIDVRPVLIQSGTHAGELDVDEQLGVGFFGTIGADDASSSVSDPSVVSNIMLKTGTVTNPAYKAATTGSLINSLLLLVGNTVGPLLDGVLRGLTNKDTFNTTAMLNGLLNARAEDPTSLATGAFAGRIIGDTRVSGCTVRDIAVTTVLTDAESTDGKLVGKGGFAGHAEGRTKYFDLVKVLFGDILADTLTTVLNAIPYVGLGDLVTVLLKNGLPLENLIPTGYSKPVITGCTVDACTLSAEDGKYGVGGFIGCMSGTEIYDSHVINCDMTVNADHFGGGFAGIERDAMIEGTLSSLQVDLSALHPQSELVRCEILDSTMLVTGGTYLGGFAGAMANSYGINDTAAGGSLTVSGTGDFVGGFTGYAHLGTLFEFGNYLSQPVSLLGTVKGLATSLLGSGGDQSLLDVGGVAPSAIMGLQITSPLTVSSEGAFVGGIVGRGNGVYITESSETYLRKLGKYDGNNPPALPITREEERGCTVGRLVSVSAGRRESGESFAGGIAGYLTSANIGGLLGDTVGLAAHLGFTVRNTNVTGEGDGYSVTAEGDYAGGGIGWAVGGSVTDAELQNLRSVESENHAGGFAGATGPGDLVNGNGLDLKLLGLDILKIDNLLSLVSEMRTTYLRADVTGAEEGYTVEETGLRTDGDKALYTAGGWAGEANSIKAVDCHAAGLLSVKSNMQDGCAGGFVGTSSAGGLAGIASTADASHVLDVGQLLNAVPYLIPGYDGCTVRYADGGFVEGDFAGGYTGDFQSGKVNTSTQEETVISGNTYTGVNPIDDPPTTYSYEYGTAAVPWSVYGISRVRGGRCAGGWGGRVCSGALASAGGGLSLLGGTAGAALDVNQLLGAASVYVPVINYAGVNTPSGFSVYAAHDYEDASAPAQEGCAGGFIGYGSGVQVSCSDVCRLRHSVPEEPSALTAEDLSAYARFNIKPAVLESQDGSSYMSGSPDAFPYAVAGACHAGGYIGHMDIGSAASVGNGLKLLGSTVDLTDVLDVLNAVISTIEHSDVEGCPGGFSVAASTHINLMDGGFGGEGRAGGYAGEIDGGHIQDGNVRLFSHIVGEAAAGGYAGEMAPGDAANVLDDGSVLGNIVNISSLLSLMQDFVPTVRNSETTCVPCGGAVRAQRFSDSLTKRGMAGGYVGHCVGGQIWGLSSDRWKGESEYNGEKRECAAVRIRSVYGAEYAGGFCGLMEPGTTAGTGGLSLLGGLLNADNLLSALNAVYPTIREAAVYGPLQKTDLATWNAWKTYVGNYGAFYPELARLSTISTQEELDAAIEEFAYGTDVVAGRHGFDNSPNTILSGCAGGFAGSMHSGTIRSCKAEKTMLVSAMRAAGGFAGEMQTKGAAEFGSVDLLGGLIPLNVGNIASLLNVFVPCISGSGTTGYEQGLTVQATGERNTSGVGCAGGFVGGCCGGQLGRKHEGREEPVWIHALQAVYGTYCVGGFGGRFDAASMVGAGTAEASSGFLQRLLDKLISTPSSLLKLLEASVCTVKYAEAAPADGGWGIIVDGRDTRGGTADYAGGFAGYLEASVLGGHGDASDTLRVTGLRSVDGGYYAGGFFGLADVTGVAEVSDGGTTSILDLVNVGNTSLLDAFRTYIYFAEVRGVEDGITVTAHKQASSGTMQSYTLSGAAGGFGGGLMNGTVENSSVSGLKAIEAPNYAAGFIGYCGKSGVLGADQVQVSDDSFLGKLLTLLGLDLNACAQLFNIVGSTATGCSAEGFAHGFTAKATSVHTAAGEGENSAFVTGSCAGGFAAYADTSQIDGCHVLGMKFMQSPQAAGGFIGRTEMAYIGDINVDDSLVAALLELLKPLIRVLRGVSSIDLIDISAFDTLGLGLKLLSDGDLLYLDLFGLEIGVSFQENDPEFGGADAVTIILGSSTIKVPYDSETEAATPNATIHLIEGNRTSVKTCSAAGVDAGYEVFGGGADGNADGSDPLGYTGGFVGFNKMGYFSHNRMRLCDVVRGTPGKTGPFTGSTDPGTRGQEYLEGNDNYYSIYRVRNPGLDHVETTGGANFGTSTDDGAGGVEYNRYDVLHYDVIKAHADLAGASQEGGSGPVTLGAWESAAKAVLMLDAPLMENPESETVKPDAKKDPCDELFDLDIHKKWRDYNNMLGTRPESLEVEIHVIDVGTRPRAQLVQAVFPESGWTHADFDVLEGQYPGFKKKLGKKSPAAISLRAGSSSSLHWAGAIEGLPAAYYAPAAEGGSELHYLQYVVRERVPENYRLVEYRIIEDTASVIILNELAGVVLPGTGGTGSLPYMPAAAAFLTAAVLLIIDMRRCRKEVKRRPGPRRTSD